MSKYSVNKTKNSTKFPKGFDTDKVGVFAQANNKTKKVQSLNLTIKGKKPINKVFKVVKGDLQKAWDSLTLFCLEKSVKKTELTKKSVKK